MNYLIKDVEVLYPRINKTYRFDSTENRSVPCDPFDEGAAYSMQFRMTEAQAKELMGVMASVYKEKREAKWPEKIPMPFKKDEEGSFIGKATLKGAYGKEATVKPSQVDAKKKPCPENFMLTTGSTANVAVVLFPYNMREAGVSLRLRGSAGHQVRAATRRNPRSMQWTALHVDREEVRPVCRVTQSAPVTAEKLIVGRGGCRRSRGTG